MKEKMLIKQQKMSWFWPGLAWPGMGFNITKQSFRLSAYKTYQAHHMAWHNPFAL